MKRATKTAYVSSSPFSSEASTPIPISKSKTSSSPIIRPAITTAISVPADSNTANVIAATAAATAAALPAAAGTVLAGAKSGGFFSSFSLRKLLWSIAILFIGWYLYTRRFRLMTWIMPERKSRMSQKRPFDTEKFTASGRLQGADTEECKVGGAPETGIENMRAKRIKKLHVDEDGPGVNKEAESGEQQNATELGTEKEAEEEQEDRHTEQEKLELLHELNQMVGDIDVFPAIPIFEPQESGVTFVVGGNLNPFQQGLQPSSSVMGQENRITEIIEESSSVPQGSSPQQQQPPTQPNPSVSKLASASTAGFGKRSRRKQE